MEPPGEVVTEQGRLGRRVDPDEADRPAAVPEVVELAAEAEVEGDVLVDELHAIDDRRLGAAAGRCPDRVRPDRQGQAVGAGGVRAGRRDRGPDRLDVGAIEGRAVLGRADVAGDADIAAVPGGRSSASSSHP